jgi:hypothetical protein
MILEWIEYLRTPASSEARRFGLVSQSIALRARALRQRRSWQSHLQNCHRVTENFIANHSEARSVSILGSGHLFDITPRLFESRSLEKLYLVDLVHPIEVRKRFRTDPRVHLIELDISGSLGQSQSNGELPMAFELHQADLVISANLMSQLPLPWTTRSGEISDSERARIENEMCQAHWLLLEMQVHRGARVLFWTDFEKVFFDAEKQIIHQESSLGNFHFPVETKNWEWDIAPIPEISSRLGLQMRVACGQI